MTALFTGLAGGICAAVYMFSELMLFQILAITFLASFYHFIMRLIVGVVYQGIFQNRMNYKNRWFHVGNREIKFYDAIKVKRWKAHMPTYDADAFDLKKHTYEEIVMATCGSELVHETIVILSFLPILASYTLGATAVFVITSLLSAVIDASFVILQRYNRPRLIKLMHRM